MLSGTIVTLLIASIVISRIEGKAIEDQRAQLDNTQPSVNGEGIVIEAVTVKNNNTFNTGPNDESIYGSNVKVENNIYVSPDSRQPTITQTRTAIAPVGPGYDGVSYVKLEERDHQGQLINKVSSRTSMNGNTFDLEPGAKHSFGSSIEDKNNVYILRGSNNQTQPNEQNMSSNEDNVGLSAETILTNNHYQLSGGVVFNAGASITRNGNVYISDKNSKTGEKTINGTKGQDIFSALWSKLQEKEQAAQKAYDDWQDKYFRKDDATESKANSSFTNHDSYPNSLIGKNAQDIKEEVANAEKHKEPNGQTRLSSNTFNPFTYFLIVLIILSVID